MKHISEPLETILRMYGLDSETAAHEASRDELRRQRLKSYLRRQRQRKDFDNVATLPDRTFCDPQLRLF